VQTTSDEQTDAVRHKRDVGFIIERPELSANSTATNKTSFEDYEKAYLINKTMAYLVQIYIATKTRESSTNNGVENVPHNTNSSNKPPHNTGNLPEVTVPTIIPPMRTTHDFRSDQLLDQWLQQLGHMTTENITRILNDVKRSAQLGVEDTDLSRLCCSMG